MFKIHGNLKLIILLIFILLINVGFTKAQLRRSKKDTSVKITFKLEDKTVFVGDTTTLSWRVSLPKGKPKVLLNGNIVGFEGEQTIVVDSASTQTLTVELPNGKVRKRIVKINPLPKANPNKYLSNDSLFQELNKFRTSSLNCQTGKRDNYYSPKELLWINDLKPTVDQVAENYKHRNEYCHETKWQQIFRPLLDYYSKKRVGIWIGIFLGNTFDYIQYCNAIKDKQFTRGYIGVYSNVAFVILESPNRDYSNEAILRDEVSTLTFLSAPIIISYQEIFGKPCSCDSTMVKIDQEKMLKMINETRKKGAICGGKQMPPSNPLKWNDTLEMTAFLHSKHMCFNDHYSHIGLDMSDPTDRAARLWYKYGVAENIAKGFLNEEHVFEGWLDSPGHCENMLNKDKREVGVSRSGEYWTMNLGYSFISREYEAKVREKENQNKALVIKEIVSNINKNRKVILTINRIFPYYISDFSERGIPDDYNRGVQLYGGVKLNCTDFNTESILKSITENPKYLELLKDTIYTDIMIETTIMDTRIMVYRPLDKIRIALIEKFGLSNILENSKLNELAFQQAKQHHFPNGSYSNLGFRPDNIQQMLQRQSINTNQYEMILVDNPNINTEVDLMAYIEASQTENTKLTKYQYNQVGFARYKNIWVVLLVKTSN